MKRIFIILLCLVAVIAEARAQDAPAANPPAQAESGPGPGKPLPPNSKPLPAPDLTGLRARAEFVAEQIREQSTDLLRFLAIIALMVAGYHAQFRGMEEFVNTLMRIVIAFALLAALSQILPVFFEARKEFIGTIPVDAVDATIQIGAMIGLVGASIFYMGPAGLGLIVTILIVGVAVLIVYTAQILFEAILIVFAPLAVACLAFRPTSGIFFAWLRTFIAVLLIPVGWMLAMLLWKHIYGLDADSAGERAGDIGACLIFTAAVAAIYLGMPMITIWLVNRTVDAAGTAMPSPQQLIAPYTDLGKARTTASTVSQSLAQSIASHHAAPQTTSGGGGQAAGAARQSGASVQYADRVRTAQQHHNT